MLEPYHNDDDGTDTTLRFWSKWITTHYDDVIMGAMASQITSLPIVYSNVYSGADQRKHQSPRQWPLWGPVNSPFKWSVTRKMVPFDDVIMLFLIYGTRAHDAVALYEGLRVWGFVSVGNCAWYLNCDPMSEFQVQFPIRTKGLLDSWSKYMFVVYKQWFGWESTMLYTVRLIIVNFYLNKS